MHIGFIGLGIMGSRMAANLQANGHTLTVHNRTHDKADALIRDGATWADTPREVAQNAEVLFTMLAHPEAVRAMAFGANGFLDAMRPRTIWVDSSTVNPSFSHEMAAEASARQVRFVDAPVAGSRDQAAQAVLTFIVGGTDEDVAAVRPLFDIMGQTVNHAGEAGMGTALKMVFNTQLAISLAAFSEGVALGESLGIPRETLFNVLIGGPVTAPFLGRKRDKMANADYDAEFPLQWMQKDLFLAGVSAQESGAVLPLTSLARELYGMAKQAGYGEQDFSALFEYLNESDAQDR